MSNSKGKLPSDFDEHETTDMDTDEREIEDSTEEMMLCESTDDMDLDETESLETGEMMLLCDSPRQDDMDTDETESLEFTEDTEECTEDMMLCEYLSPNREIDETGSLVELVPGESSRIDPTEMDETNKMRDIEDKYSDITASRLRLEEMRRHLCSSFTREMASLHQGPDHNAMINLRLTVKVLDASMIRLFVAQLSQVKEIGSWTSGYTVSLFEDLARVHGVNIAPHVEIIMPAIVRTLSSSEGSLRAQQACSKVVAAMARYGIDPETPEDQKRNVVHSLCNPLSDSLIVYHQQHLALGSALCLESLMLSDCWRFASTEMITTVCHRLAALVLKMAAALSQFGTIRGTQDLILMDPCAQEVQSGDSHRHGFTGDELLENRQQLQQAGESSSPSSSISIHGTTSPTNTTEDTFERPNSEANLPK